MMDIGEAAAARETADGEFQAEIADATGESGHEPPRKPMRPYQEVRAEYEQEDRKAMRVWPGLVKGGSAIAALGGTGYLGVQQAFGQLGGAGDAAVAVAALAGSVAFPLVGAFDDTYWAGLRRNRLRDEKRQYRLVGEEDRDDVHALLDDADAVWHRSYDGGRADLGSVPDGQATALYDGILDDLDRAFDTVYQEAAVFPGEERFGIITYVDDGVLDDDPMAAHVIVGTGDDIAEYTDIGHGIAENTELYETVRAAAKPYDVEAARERIPA